MKFDYFNLMTAAPGTPYHQVLAEVVAQVQVAEATGATTFWQSEHHFGSEGFDIQPNPILTCMHLAPRVSEIRLGIAAVILPEWHPLRLAEDVAFLDHSVMGRLELAVAKGITNRELSNLSPYEVDRRFPEANEAIFLESLEILKKAWTQDSFTHSGEYYRFPRPGVPDRYSSWLPASGEDAGYKEYRAMSVIPRPYQQPHPPLWIVGDSMNTFLTGARLGCKPIAWLPSRGHLKLLFEAYQQNASETQGRQLQLGEDAGIMRVCYVARTASEARRIAEPGVEHLYKFVGGQHSGKQVFAEPGEVLSDAEMNRPWFEFLYERSHLFVGTPDDVCEQIASMRDWLGLERLLLFTKLPGMANEDALSSMELFGKEVLPNVA